MTPFLEDPDFTLYNGNVLDILPGLAAESVHCVVTSPPYWGLRDYGTGQWDGGDPDCDHLKQIARDPHERKTSTLDGGTDTIRIQEEANVYRETCGKCGARRVDNQLGLEATPDEYLANMLAVFREVRRVLRSDGTCWVNMGDSYASGLGGGRQGETGQRASRTFTAEGMGKPVPPGLKPKDLCMIPARLALALQAVGWWLRSQIVWSKPNPMPESVTDRPTTSHEYVYLLSKSPRYFFDQEAVREPQTTVPVGFNGRTPPPNKGRVVERSDGQDRAAHMTNDGWIPNAYNNPAGRNLRSVWEIATQPYPEAHFATYPEELVRRCILAGTSEKGCCPECGAPWEREVEVELVASARKRDKRAYPSPRDGGVGDQGHARSSSHVAGLSRSATTTGWAPSCNHDTTPTPCTVLDPFMGSGTTALVARKHGRRSIGVELSREYCELASRRLSQLSLLAGSV